LLPVLTKHSIESHRNYILFCDIIKPIRSFLLPNYFAQVWVAFRRDWWEVQWRLKVVGIDWFDGIWWCWEKVWAEAFFLSKFLSKCFWLSVILSTQWSELDFVHSFEILESTFWLTLIVWFSNFTQITMKLKPAFKQFQPMQTRGTVYPFDVSTNRSFEILPLSTSQNSLNPSNTFWFFSPTKYRKSFKTHSEFCSSNKFKASRNDPHCLSYQTASRVYRHQKQLIVLNAIW
jgi:hypothetical protein